MRIPLDEVFRGWVKNRMESRKVTQQELAEAVGKTQSGISQFINSKIGRLLARADALAIALGAQIEIRFIELGEHVTHDLKTHPIFFQSVKTGEKNFEVRKNDRDFKVGDHLLLREWCPYKKRYTGDWLIREVTYIMKGPAFGIDADHCVMGLRTPETIRGGMDTRSLKFNKEAA